jgi:excisionase family DNA binding protein
MNQLNHISTASVLHSSPTLFTSVRGPAASSGEEARSYFQRRGAAPAATTVPAPAPLGNRAQPGSPILPSRRGSTAEAAQILGCSTSLVRWLIATGELRHVERPGKRQYLLDLDEVHRYRLKKMEERY